ncbi:MAG TPA: proline dehydrogenase family protein, partial [Novosphingobium sp.]|nr:proline dehydrogenase family protein [Novosphingobium sp.]
MPAQPFACFAPPVSAQTPLRRAITAASLRPEAECVGSLLAQARLPAGLGGAIAATATRLVEALRAMPARGGIGELVREYALSSQEGVALMCLAEALLRIPDMPTRDALIRDKVAGADWPAHLGKGRPLFVNAATWGLMVTGRLVGSHDEEGLTAALIRLWARAGEPVIRRGLDIAVGLMGEQFVCGETIGEALAHARRREGQGFAHSYDMLGEAATTAQDAARYLADYEQAIHAIGAASA